MILQTTTNRILFASLLVSVGAFGRLIPHAWNMTPIVAIGLVAGVYLGVRYSWVVPLVAMLISDFFLGFYSAPVMLSVYVSFALIGLLGLLLRESNTWGTRVLASISASTLFFLVTNWAVWQFSPMYSKTLDGLLTSYAFGLPFFKNAFVGDLMYTLGLFAAVEVAFLVYKKHQSLKFRRLKLITITT